MKSKAFPHDLFQPDLSKSYDKVFQNKLIATGHNHFAEIFSPLCLCSYLFCDHFDRHNEPARPKQAADLWERRGIALKLISFALLGLASNNNAYIWVLYAFSASGMVGAALWLHFAPDTNRFFNRLRASQAPQSEGGA